MTSAQTERLQRRRNSAVTINHWTMREKYLLDQLLGASSRIDALLSRVESLESAERERQAAMGRD